VSTSSETSQSVEGLAKAKTKRDCHAETRDNKKYRASSHSQSKWGTALRIIDTKIEGGIWKTTAATIEKGDNGW